MKKDRFGRYLPIMTAVTAMAIYPAVSNAQSMTDKAKSAMSDTAEQAKTLVAGAPAGTPADILSEIHETDQAEMEVGRMAERKDRPRKFETSAEPLLMTIARPIAR